MHTNYIHTISEVLVTHTVLQFIVKVPKVHKENKHANSHAPLPTNIPHSETSCAPSDQKKVNCKRRTLMIWVV